MDDYVIIRNGDLISYTPPAQIALEDVRRARATLERTWGEERGSIEAALEKVREAEMMLEEVLRG